MRHVNSNLRIEVEGPDRATGTAYIALYAGLREADEGPAMSKLVAPRMVGAYTDEFVRTDAGWRFARRSFEGAFALAPA